MNTIHPSFNQAEEATKKGAYEDALSLYAEAILAEPANPVYYSQRGVCHYHLKRFDEALADMNKAVELDPSYSYRYASRAYIKDAMGDVKGGIADYQKAIELDPEDAVSYNNLGLLEEKLGYIEASKKNFKKADELAKLLEETGIVTEKELMNSKAAKPQNIQKELDQKKEEKVQSSISEEIKGVFTKKDTFREFVSFIRNGFKTKE